MKGALVFLAILLAIPFRLAGQSTDSTPTKVTFAGFVDGYYAYDTGRPRQIDRAFTTQPARHNEFNVNLAYLEAKIDGPRVRGRVALQAGTSVQSNYAGEPSIGSVSGASLSRHIQEATVGYRVRPGFWVDAGVYLSHIGSESWISRDNLTYTRSLTADYSPYYQAGVKATWSGSKVTAQLNLVNGWQIISENNQSKAIGARLDYSPSPRVTLSFYNLLGNEMPDSLASRTRVFQGGSVRVAPTARLTLVGTFDLGWQAGPDGASGSTWYGTAWIGRALLSKTVSMVARLERYADPDQVIVATGTANGFKANGGSIGLDIAPERSLLWRVELRGLTSKSRLFPDRDSPTGLSTGNGVLVTSLALSF